MYMLVQQPAISSFRPSQPYIRLPQTSSLQHILSRQNHNRPPHKLRLGRELRRPGHRNLHLPRPQRLDPVDLLVQPYEPHSPGIERDTARLRVEREVALDSQQDVRGRDGAEDCLRFCGGSLLLGRLGGEVLDVLIQQWGAFLQRRFGGFGLGGRGGDGFTVEG